MKTRVAILGCGPSGLLAAHAAKLCGAEVKVFSRKVPSRIHGAQYIHREIEGLSPRFALIQYQKLGTKSGYARKVYGDENHPCSWDKFQVGRHAAWSTTDVYEQLWDRWEKDIINTSINSGVASLIGTMGFDVLISTIPLPSICNQSDEHYFDAKTIWVKNGDWPGWFTPESDIIIYNGDPKNMWYRYSKLFGFSFMEYAHGVGEGNGIKPINHNCDCHPEWLKMGRFGRWERGILAHHSYEGTIRALQQLRGRDQAHSLR